MTCGSSRSVILAVSERNHGSLARSRLAAARRPRYREYTRLAGANHSLAQRYGRGVHEGSVAARLALPRPMTRSPKRACCGGLVAPIFGQEVSEEFPLLFEQIRSTSPRRVTTPSIWSGLILKLAPMRWRGGAGAPAPSTGQTIAWRLFSRCWMGGLWGRGGGSVRTRPTLATATAAGPLLTFFQVHVLERDEHVHSQVLAVRDARPSPPVQNQLLHHPRPDLHQLLDQFVEDR